jgi:hypothetical protein
MSSYGLPAAIHIFSTASVMVFPLVRQQRRSRDLRFGQRHRLRHADVDQMLSELPGEIVEADSAARSSRRRSRQLIRKVGGQCGGRDPASAHQPPQLPREMTVGPDRPAV